MRYRRHLSRIPADTGTPPVYHLEIDVRQVEGARLPADFAAGAAIPPNMYLACDFEDLRQQRRVQLLRALLCHQRYRAVLPPMGIAGMPSLR